jgi:hypothetical protein
MMNVLAAGLALTVSTSAFAAKPVKHTWFQLNYPAAKFVFSKMSPQEFYNFVFAGAVSGMTLDPIGPNDVVKDDDGNVVSVPIVGKKDGRGHWLQLLHLD